MKHTTRLLTHVALAGLAALGCRRDADAPLPPSVLFPDASAASAGGDQPPSGAESGGATRAEPITEAEPNDSATQAQPLTSQAVVRGQLWAAGGQQDRDWYRLPAVPPGHAISLDLRQAPGCAVLELLDDTGVRVSRKAIGWRSTRPVLPMQAGGQGVSLVRITCKGKPLTEAVDGAYILLVSSRALGPLDEWERNDSAGTDAQVLTLDAAVSATLAPVGDIDRFALPSDPNPETRWMLTAAGLPDVALDLLVRDPLTGASLLKRRAMAGEALLVAGLDPALLRGKDGRMALVEVSAAHGQAPDADYALTLRRQTVPGCTRADGCPEQQLDEREPNDTEARAQVWTPVDPTRPAVWQGHIDDDLDEDWLAPARPDSASLVQLGVTAPAEAGLQVEWWQGATLLARLELEAATTASWAAMPCTPQTRWKIRAAKGGGGGAYRLEVTPVDAALFESEFTTGGRPRPANGSAAAPLAAIAAGEWGCEEGGFGRRGVLHETADRDVYSWQHSGEAWTGELRCESDGKPGLRCVLRDATDRILADLAPPVRGEAPATPLRLEPGAYRIEMSANPPRPSATPYLVTLASDADLAALLPAAATPSVPAAPVPAPGAGPAAPGRPPAAGGGLP